MSQRSSSDKRVEVLLIHSLKAGHVLLCVCVSELGELIFSSFFFLRLATYGSVSKSVSMLW